MARLVFSVILLLSSFVEAAVITVTTTADENDNNGQCSLREAVLAANNAVTPPTGCAAGTGATVDVIMVPAGTYNLTLSGSGENSAATGDLDLTDSVVIEGAGQATTIIDAQTLTDRVFHVITNNTNITFRNVAISGGHAPSVSPPNASGGGVSTTTSARSWSSIGCC